MSELVSLVAAVLRVPADEVDDETGSATTSAWSSLRHMEIVVGVEKTYGVRLTPREARSCRSVRALRDVLVGKGVTP
ncbi:acyl carrier protein [Saccharothrix syringae]|uniref:Acyl carrier protein n=1 Tax=Saccharothrix syringae TaxID=103733 RepID=A0A5Q0H4N0_SACSY|nr:acyl carrier protein [Saccharothrix syringae]QFZ21178.1 acyl carrier protein [Saccharothrix syringae]